LLTSNGLIYAKKKKHANPAGFPKYKTVTVPLQKLQTYSNYISHHHWHTQQFRMAYYINIKVLGTTGIKMHQFQKNLMQDLRFSWR
jgi:hypothetical protein